MWLRATVSHMTVRRISKRVWRRLGRRGVSLLFVGALSAVLAFSLLTVGPEQRSSPGYAVLADLAPLEVWATVWAVTVPICWVQAFMIQDRVAYAVATAIWWAYGIAYIVGVFTGLNPRGWVLGLVWLAFGGWLNLIATWPEAPPKVVEHAESD